MLLSLQYLRALAAMLVVIQHTQVKGDQYLNDPLSFFHIGHAGVDLFFIISGFIMCYTTAHKNISFKTFMVHRFERILPLYWILTAAAFAAYLVAPSLINSGGGKTVIVESFLLIPTADKFLIKNGWTLSYEFFFYILFALPLLLPFINKEVGSKYRQHILTSTLILSLVAIGVILDPTKAVQPLLAFATHPLLLEFIMGMFAFHFYKKFKHPLLIVSFIVISMTWFLYANSMGFANPRVLHYGVPSLLMLIALMNIEPYFKKHQDNLASKFLKLLGDASYSLYLVHPFALVIAAKILQKVGFIGGAPLFVFGLIASSTFAGVLCYLLVEKPINKWVKEVFHAKN